MKKNHKLQVAGKRFLVALLLAVLFFSACGKKGSGTTVVLTTGLAGDEIFRIENIASPSFPVAQATYSPNAMASVSGFVNFSFL